MRKLLVILQNPYDKGELSKGWNPSRWRSEYNKSRSGQRLHRALPTNHFKIHFTNANPKIGWGPDWCSKPNFDHLRRVLKRLKPDVILACGQVAESAVIELRKPGHHERELLTTFVIIPHPAFRLLHNNTLAAAQAIFEALGRHEQPLNTRVRFKQLRDGKFHKELIE